MKKIIHILFFLIISIYVIGIILIKTNIFIGGILILLSACLLLVIIKKSNIKMNEKSKKILLINIIFITLLGLYFYYENNTLEITNYTIIDNKIPISFNDFKIIQITDYHNNKSKRIDDKLIDNIKKEKPDIIVITGDLIDSNRLDIETSIEFIKKINKLSSIYYVPGNHEGNINKYDKLKVLLSENNVIVLENDKVLLNKKSDFINLIGIIDPFFKSNKISDKAIVNNYINEIDYNKDYYTILLSHRPELIEEYSKHNINLVFSGHAHGGQIRIPYLGGLYAPHQGFLPLYEEGLHKIKDTNLIVSRGIGNSTFPFRVNNNPELVITTLKNK